MVPVGGSRGFLLCHSPWQNPTDPRPGLRASTERHRMILNGRQRRIGASSSPPKDSPRPPGLKVIDSTAGAHRSSMRSTKTVRRQPCWRTPGSINRLRPHSRLPRSTLPAQDQCRRRPVPRCGPYVKTAQNVRLPGIVVSHHTALEPAFCSSNRSRGRISGSA